MNYEKFYLIGFWIATLYAFVMLPYNLERMQRVDSIETKTTTNTELLETEGDWKENLQQEIQTLWTLIPQASANSNVKNAETYGDQKSNDIFKENQSLVTNTVKTADGWNSGSSSKIRTPKQIFEQVKHLWFREAPTVSIIWACKGSTRDVQKCILVSLTLLYNEAGNKQNSKACIERRNCFGINAWKTVFKSYDEASERWVNTFDKWWYKAESPSFFYSEKWKLSPSRYCVSEESSNSAVWCPRWLLVAKDKWAKIYPIIY